MPFVLKFGVYQCECGEIFKREDMLKKHCEKWGHNPFREYTVVVKIARPEKYVEVGIFEGKAETSYK